MILRDSVETKQSIAVSAWQIQENAYNPATKLLHETLFAQGNGYIGLRGAHEDQGSDASGASLDGTYLNGFYETEAIVYPETAYGFARTKEFMLNVPNGKCIELLVDGECFSLDSGTIDHYCRTLDFASGIGRRELEWTSPTGRRLRIVSERIVSFAHKNLYAIRYAVTALDGAAIECVSMLNGEVKNLEAGDDPRIGTTVAEPPLVLTGVKVDEGFVALCHRTRNSGFSLLSANTSSGVGADGAQIAGDSWTDGNRAGVRYQAKLAAGETIVLTKFGCYLSSRDFPADELVGRGHALLEASAGAGFNALCAAQTAYLEDFWTHADVHIDGDAALQQGLRFNLFHLLQSVGRDGKTNIAAKGVTGEGYDGHYFWDTEIYVFPFFLYTYPSIARKLLEYRYSGLPKARERARQMSHAKGALYPWRTIAGEECSAYFPAGTAQYHINADVAYSIKQYFEATGDMDYMCSYGAEIVMDTARIWMGIGAYMPRHKNQFGIFEVTGPDEYTACVNNNFYTNAMAQMHLRFAADIAARVRETDPAAFARIEAALQLEAIEVDAWQRAAAAMFLPYDESLGINPQDDGFLDKPVWDLANTPAENYPLLLNYHPLVIYRHQVCKQADVVLAMLLLGEHFTADQVRRNYDYYERITTHDSSLSSCIFGIVAAQAGYREQASGFYNETARMDLDNLHGNTEYGVHTAAMAGSWLGLTYGFGGFRVYEGKVYFSPYLPTGWNGYSFRISIHGCQVELAVSSGSARYTLLDGECLQFSHAGSVVEISRTQPQREFVI